MFKQEKGVTLVALVITIIVLLILAGVSISLVAGDNGVMSRAQKAATKTKYGTVTEAVSIALADLNSAYAEDFADGKAGALTSYFTEDKVIEAFKQQGLSIEKCTATGSKDTGFTYTDDFKRIVKTVPSGSESTQIAADSTIYLVDGATCYRVYIGDQSKDFVETTFKKGGMGYSATFSDGLGADHVTIEFGS